MSTFVRWARGLHGGQLVLTWLVLVVAALVLGADGDARLAEAERRARVPPCSRSVPVEAWRDCDPQPAATRAKQIDEPRKLARAEQVLALLLLVAGVATTWIWFDGRKPAGRPGQS